MVPIYVPQDMARTRDAVQSVPICPNRTWSSWAARALTCVQLTSPVNAIGDVQIVTDVLLRYNRMLSQGLGTGSVMLLLHYNIRSLPFPESECTALVQPQSVPT